MNVQNQAESNFKSTMIGATCIAVGELLFTVVMICMKLATCSEAQFIIGRYSIAFLIASSWWKFAKPSNVNHWYGDKPYILNIWMRTLFYSISIGTYNYAIYYLPLGDQNCIMYQGPLITAILGWIFLKEKLPKLTPIIIILATVGIIFVSQPTFLIKIYYQLTNSDNHDLESLDTV